MMNSVNIVNNVGRDYPLSIGVHQGDIRGGDPMVERYNRRMDTYRQHHKEVGNRYEYGIDEVSEAQRRQKVLLHQRWVESRTKLATGKARTRGDLAPSSGISAAVSHFYYNKIIYSLLALIIFFISK